jgi:Endonuclease/Exonuclease/phosphatase family
MLGRLSLVLSLVGVGLVVVFAVSRVLTDRFGWSQWVWWVPAVWWVVVVWWVWVVSRVIGWWSIHRGGRYGKKAVVRRVLLMGCVGVSVFVAFGEQRWYRVVWGDGLEDRAAAAVRVAHWNIAGAVVDEDAAIGLLNSLDVDVVLLSNARWDAQQGVLLEGLDVGSGDDGRVVKLAQVVKLGRAIVVSRLGASAASMVYVRGDADDGEGMRSTGDLGWVCRVKIDGEDGRGLVVWLVDLPSEPTVHRGVMMDRVVEAVRNDLGQVRVFGEDGVMRFEANDGRLDAPGLIVGDFNTPRGSWSLGKFDVFGGGDGFVDAFERVGYGFGRSWVPGVDGWWRKAAVGIAGWHIDLSLVGNGWEATGYGLFGEGLNGDAIGGAHRIQVVDLK